MATALGRIAEISEAEVGDEKQSTNEVFTAFNITPSAEVLTVYARTYKTTVVSV